MSDIAIRVEDLSKQYRIGAKQEGYRTLRDTMTGALVSPFRRARRLLSGEAHGATKLKETIWALKDVTFEIKQGEVVGIIGRNGAGKTTLLKILSRITEPTQGYAEIRGRVGSLLEVGTGFHPELTGLENIYLNGAILGMKKAEIEQKFDEIVDFAEIEKFINTPVKHYSSGMYVRLAFSVAAHLEPEILLVDEVLAVGDVAFQKKCLGKMGVVAKAGRTVLFVSHNMNAILNLCERALLIKNGEVLFFGNTQEAVDLYLSESNNLQYGYADLSSHSGRTAGMSVIAQSIGLYTSKSSREYSEGATSGDDLSFRIHYDCGQHSIDLVQLGISTLMGQRVFTIGTHLCPDFDDTLRGRGVIECYLPNVRLTAGEYTVTVMMGKRMPSRNIDCIDNALRFRIEDGNYFGTGLAPLPGQGSLAQRSEWKVDRE